MSERPIANVVLERVGDEQPHYCPPGEDCMGGHVPPYWRQFVKCFDGSMTLGTGDTAELAVLDATKNRGAREKEIRFGQLQPALRIKELLQRGCRGTQKQEDFNRAVAALLGIPLEVSGRGAGKDGIGE